MSEQGMRVVVGQLSEPTEEKLCFTSRIGVTRCPVNKPKLPGYSRQEEADIRAPVGWPAPMG